MNPSHPAGTRNSAKEILFALRKKRRAFQDVGLQYSFSVHQKTYTRMVRAALIIIPQNPNIHQEVNG